MPPFLPVLGQGFFRPIYVDQVPHKSVVVFVDVFSNKLKALKHRDRIMVSMVKNPKMESIFYKISENINSIGISILYQ